MSGMVVDDSRADGAQANPTLLDKLWNKTLSFFIGKNGISDEQKTEQALARTQKYMIIVLPLFGILGLVLLSSLMAFFVLLSQQIDFGGSTWIETGIPLFVSQGCFALIMIMIFGLFGTSFWTVTEDCRGIFFLMLPVACITIIAIIGSSVAFPILILLYLDGRLPQGTTLASIFILVWLHQAKQLFDGFSGLFKAMAAGNEVEGRVLLFWNWMAVIAEYLCYIAFSILLVIKIDNFPDGSINASDLTWSTVFIPIWVLIGLKLFSIFAVCFISCCCGGGPNFTLDFGFVLLAIFAGMVFARLNGADISAASCLGVVFFLLSVCILVMIGGAIASCVGAGWMAISLYSRNDE